jgi:DNA-binding transcriptional LysR family regulator
VRVEIEDVPPIRRQIYAVWRSDEPPTEVVEQFLDAFTPGDEGGDLQTGP